MKTLLVLCAGEKTLNGVPVYLNRYPDGKMLAEKSVEGIYSENYSKISFVLLEKDCEEYRADALLNKELGKKYPVSILKLRERTDGPASTVYQALQLGGMTGAFAVRDSLNGIRIMSDCQGNYVAGLDLTKYAWDVKNLRSKSFIVTNEQNQVLDIIEKKFRSDVISVGLYGFHSADDFCMAYQHLNDKNYPIEKLYVSHIISYLIGCRQRVFHCLNVTAFDDWSSEDAWALLQKKHAVCFVNLNQMTADGTRFLPEAEDLLISNSQKGMSFIMFTSKKDLNEWEMKCRYQSKGINCVSVIKGVSASRVQGIANTVDELKNFILGA